MNLSNQTQYIYEIILSQPGSHRKAKFLIKVPYQRMSQIMQEMSRFGGKIIKITPVGNSSVFTAWWVEITTISPHCQYYFGPFDTETEAKEYLPGYIEDLEEEGARGIKFKIEYSQPQILTREWE